MAAIDYGILIFKNNELIKSQYGPVELKIDGHIITLEQHSFFVKYDENILYEMENAPFIKHPFTNNCKPKSYKLNGTSIYIKPIRDKYDANNSIQNYVYIRTKDNNIYNCFTGYGIDYYWWKYTKSYDYPKWLINKLNQVDKRRHKR